MVSKAIIPKLERQSVSGHSHENGFLKKKEKKGDVINTQDHTMQYVLAVTHINICINIRQTLIIWV